MKTFSVDNLYSGLIYDVLYLDLQYRNPCVLPSSIRPIFSLKRPLLGRIFTCKGKIVEKREDIDDTVRLKMLSAIPKDCIMIYDTGCYNVAHFGDITATIAKKAGCQGVIIDGCTRDVEAIKKLNFPVFCVSTTPIDSYGYWQVTEYQIPLTLYSTVKDNVIYPTDYIFADNTGIVVIPNTHIIATLELARIRLKKEKYLKKQILKNSNVNLIEAYKNLGIH